MSYYTIINYLDSLIPYINKLKSSKIKLSNDHLELLAYLESSEWVPNLQVRPIDSNKNASSNLIYLIEAFMYFNDRNNNFSDTNKKYCANIHDGWAIARIIDWNGQEFVDYKSSQLPSHSSELIINFNRMLENETILNINLLLNRGDTFPEITIGNINVPCNEFYINIVYKDINTRIRGDQLSMFIPFLDLTEKIQKQDQTFVNKIQDKEKQINDMINQCISYSFFNVIKFGICKN